ncbi:MAG: hypothetical protein NZ651_04825 [Candidatus Bipolaricaulota bacterium]|nr:hypothetical protein [Candidatus Bipolaricaulota bacterium]MDW8127077.1 hypothetical protein [Candidatus Bipolaricaulota bacterium]
MLVTNGNGIPLGFVLSRADRAEIRLAKATRGAVRVPRRRGRPQKRPPRWIAEKGYNCDEFRA